MNPLMEEIFQESLIRLENKQPLAPVQEVVMREWCEQATVRRDWLLSKSKAGIMTLAQYDELQLLLRRIELYENRER